MPDPGDPQALNRYTYTLNQPLRYTDPSGHAYAIDADAEYWQGPDGQLLVHSINSGVSKLVAEMNTGLTSAMARLDELHRSSAFVASVPLDTHSGVGAVTGDEGFRPEFRDAAEGYGKADYPSKQTGHFLTAVTMGGLFAGDAKSDERMRKLITAHEMRSDMLLGIDGLGVIPQLVLHQSVSSADTFASAVQHYNDRNFAAMEVDVQALWSRSQKGQGNSTADVRLSIAGYALGQAVRGGSVATNRDMAWWVVNHVADQ